MAFRTRGMNGYAKIIDTAVENAQYFYEKIKLNDKFEVAVKPEISSVVFRVNGSDDLNKKIRRNLLEKGIVIGQTVKDGKTMLKFTLLNPRLKREKIDSLISQILCVANTL